MALFGRIVIAAVLAGLLAGLVNAGLQQWRLVPLILHAETFETGGTAHDHAAATGQAANEHLHDKAWTPADGFERTGYTVLATTLAGIGFALALAALATLTGLALTPATGLFWSLGGFVAVSLAPALGLAPELPGMPAADLGARQLWWWGVVLATATAALILAKWRNGTALGIALVLCALPHLIGAPQPPEAATKVPAELASAFAANAIGVAFAFWLICGTALGYLMSRPTSQETT